MVWTQALRIHVRKIMRLAYADALVLGHFDSDAEIIVNCDTSCLAIGYILIQNISYR